MTPEHFITYYRIRPPTTLLKALLTIHCALDFFT